MLSLLACLALSFSAFAQEEEENKNGKKEKGYEDIITEEAVTDDGLFTVHKVDDK